MCLKLSWFCDSSLSVVCSYFTAPSLLGDLVALKVPGAVHHGLEVVISIDGHGDIVVVLEPLWHRDLSVSGVGLTSHVAEVVLESVEELSEDLLLSLLSSLHIWMLLGVVSLSDIVDINLARAVRVHHLVSFLSDSSSSGVHLTSDASKELIVGDLTISISVEYFESGDNLWVRKTDSEIVHGLLELLLVKRLRVVIVSNLEFLADTHDTSSSSSGNFGLNMLHDLSLVGVSWNSSLGLSLLWCWSAENVVVSLSSWLSISPSLGSLTLSRLFSEFPGITDHGHEVHVIIDGAGDVVVVLLELLLGHDVVWSRVVSHVMSCFKSLEELLEDLVLGLLSRDNIWMLVGLVNTSDIIEIDPAVSVFIELLISLGNNLLSSHVHWSSDGSDELIISDGATRINIEILEKGRALWLGKTKFVVCKGFVEFIIIQSLGVIVIHNFELPLEADHSSGTSRSQLVLQGLGEGFWISG